METYKKKLLYQVILQKITSHLYFPKKVKIKKLKICWLIGKVRASLKKAKQYESDRFLDKWGEWRNFKLRFEWLSKWIR